jgi:hypothetical protein
MADLASSAVTLNRYWYEGLQRNVQCKDVTLVLTGQGGTTNKIPASVLGFTKVIGNCSLVKSDNSVIVNGVADYAGDNLLLQEVTAEYDDPDVNVTSAPGDFTGTFRGVVKGI